MMKKIIALSMVFNCGFILGWGNNNPQYNNAAFNTIDQGIENILNLSSSDVALLAGTPSDVANFFKKVYLTDAEEGAQISGERRMQELVTLAKVAYGERPVSGVTLEATDLYETTALKLDAKEKSLEAEKDGLFAAKIGWGMATVVGVCGLGLAAKIAGDRGDKTAVKIIGGVSTGVVVIGGAKLISNIGKENVLETNIVQFRTMKNGWENRFKVK